MLIYSRYSRIVFMKIILLQDIKGIGRRGELKEVKDGFARNFLIPQKQAEAATPEVVARWQKVRANKEKQGEEDLERISRAKEKLTSLVFNVELKTIHPPKFSEDKLGSARSGGVVESVNKQSIKDFLEKQGIKNVEKDRIHLEHNLKEVGEHLVKISLGRGAEAELRVLISHK